MIRDRFEDIPKCPLMNRTPGRAETIVLPTAPRAARGLDIDESRIPNAPPYTAYVANLPYDVDSEEIMDFFGKLKVRKGLKITVNRVERSLGKEAKIRFGIKKI